MARRYEFYFRVAKQYFTNKRSAIKFISLSRRVMFFLLCRQKDIDKTRSNHHRLKSAFDMRSELFRAYRQKNLMKHNVKKQTIHVHFIDKRLIEHALHNYIASVNNRPEKAVS